MTDQRFREAVELYGDMVFRLAYSYLKNRADAEDVMQEVFLRLMKAGPVFESEEHAKAWLLRVASNCASDLFRLPWRKREGPLEDNLSAPEAPEAARAMALKSTSSPIFTLAAWTFKIDSRPFRSGIFSSSTLVKLPPSTGFT